MLFAGCIVVTWTV